VAGVKLNKVQDAPEPAAPRGRRLGWLLEPTYDPEPLRRLGHAMRANLTPVALWRKHRLFSLLVVLSIVPRVLATLAFRPAELIPDSFSYMQEGVHLTLGTLRPAGYPLLLRILEPFHSLVLVTTVQHVMGIAAAVIVYGLLRSKGLPGWGACLAAAPTLFDPRQLWLESSILPDTTFALVILVSVAVLLTERKPKAWQCVVAGLLISWASILRGNGVPIIVAILAFMLVRRVGWRAFTAGLAAFALPLIAYTALFHSDYGQYDITDSTGMFLWSRTMSFANCDIIKPPPDLRPLCPTAQPYYTAHAKPWSVSAVTDPRSPADFMWASGAWWRHDAHPGINAYNNKLAMRFALDAIEAQPGAYAKVVGRDVMLTFLNTDRPQNILALSFTAKPDVPTLSRSEIRYEREYGHVAGNTHPVQPYAYLLMFYQLPVYFPGWAYFLVIVAGAAGIVRGWRRRRKGRNAAVAWPIVALPWASAVIIIVGAPALQEYLYRYAISAVPLACLAAGLAFVRRPGLAVATDGAHVYPPQAPSMVGETLPETPVVSQEAAADETPPTDDAAPTDEAAEAQEADEAPADGPVNGVPDFEADTDPGWDSPWASPGLTEPGAEAGPGAEAE
jgi:hypothetical protein